MAGPSDDRAREDVLLSKRMFLGGCLGLPWLWICNALYFRARVFAPLVWVDYWPGGAPPTATAGGDDENENTTAEQRLAREAEQQELAKWVTRSARGAAVVVPLFVAWVVTFQVLKEDFGPRWFVMDETDAEVTGW